VLRTTGLALVLILLAGAVSIAAAAPSIPGQAGVGRPVHRNSGVVLYRVVVKKFGDNRPFASWIRRGPADRRAVELPRSQSTAWPCRPHPTPRKSKRRHLQDACRIAGQVEGERVIPLKQFLKTIKEAVVAATEMRDALSAG
jgi:hypothetical protein